MWNNRTGKTIDKGTAPDAIKKICRCNTCVMCRCVSLCVAVCRCVSQCFGHDRFLSAPRFERVASVPNAFAALKPMSSATLISFSFFFFYLSPRRRRLSVVCASALFLFCFVPSAAEKACTPFRIKFDRGMRFLFWTAPQAFVSDFMKRTQIAKKIPEWQRAEKTQETDRRKKNQKKERFCRPHDQGLHFLCNQRR